MLTRRHQRGCALLSKVLAAVLGIIMELLQGLGQLSSKSAMDVHGTWWRGCLRSMSGFTLLLSIDQFKERTCREHEYGIVLQCDLYRWLRWPRIGSLMYSKKSNETIVSMMKNNHPLF